MHEGEARQGRRRPCAVAAHPHTPLHCWEQCNGKRLRRFATHEFQPTGPHTNTPHVPALLCAFYLTCEWFVSHRFHPDIDDYNHNQAFAVPTLTSRAVETELYVASVVGANGDRGRSVPVHWVWGHMPGTASAQWRQVVIHVARVPVDHVSVVNPKPYRPHVVGALDDVCAH